MRKPVTEATTNAAVFGLFPDRRAAEAAAAALYGAGFPVPDVRVLTAAGTDWLLALGLAEPTARRFASGLRDDGALLSVATGGRADEAEAVLTHHGALTARTVQGLNSVPSDVVTPATGALAGAATGAVAGGTVGAVAGGPVGAVIGGILGAAAGAAGGEAVQRQAEGAGGGSRGATARATSERRQPMWAGQARRRGGVRRRSRRVTSAFQRQMEEQRCSG